MQDFIDQFKSASSQINKMALFERGHSQAVELIKGCDLKPKPIMWFWPGWLAAGKVHILAGVAGTGKTTIGMMLAATLTTGARWPDGSYSPKGNVVIWSGEDDPTDTLAPRLIASGADMGRVFFINGVRKGNRRRNFSPSSDVQILSQKLSEIDDVKLLIVDPIVSAVIGDSHKNAEVRRSLQPLADLAVSTRLALLGITHFSKGTVGREPLERVTGSLAFGALARIVLVATEVRANEEKQGIYSRLLLRAKNNLGRNDGGFRYELHQRELEAHPDIFASFVLWGGPVEGTACEMLTEAESSKSAENVGVLGEAKCFLTDLLKNDTSCPKAIKKEAEEACISWSTIRRAKEALGLKSRKKGMKEGWEWFLPRRDSKNLEEAQNKKASTFTKFEHLQCQSESKLQESENHATNLDFEERAAIMEYDGGLSRKKAEKMARKYMSR